MRFREASTVKINCKNFENYHRKHFCLSRQKRSKAHRNRLKQYRNWKESRAWEERKNSRCAPPRIISWRHHCLQLKQLQRHLEFLVKGR